MKNIIRSFVILALFFLCSLPAGAMDVLQDNEYYKKGVELLDQAKKEFDAGEYDMGYDHSEQARAMFEKAGQFYMIQIYIIRINAIRAEAEKWINTAESMGVKSIDDLSADYGKSKGLFASGDDLFAQGNNKEDFGDKTDTYQKSYDAFNGAAELAKKLVNELGVDKESAYALLQQAQNRHDELVKNKVISPNDKDDSLISSKLKDGKDAFDKANYYMTKKRSEEALDYMDKLAMKKEAEKLLKEARNGIDNAASMGGTDKYPDEMKRSEDLYAQAKDLFDKGSFKESIENSKNILELLSKLELEAVFPKYYVIVFRPNWRDCLWRISGFSFVYSNPLLWEELYKANKETLLQPDNPDLIHPRRVLVIPSIRGEKRECYYDPKKKYPRFNARINYSGIKQ